MEKIFQEDLDKLLTGNDQSFIERLTMIAGEQANNQLFIFKITELIMDRLKKVPYCKNKINRNKLSTQKEKDLFCGFFPCISLYFLVKVLCASTIFYLFFLCSKKTSRAPPKIIQMIFSSLTHSPFYS